MKCFLRNIFILFCLNSNNIMHFFFLYLVNIYRFFSLTIKNTRVSRVYFCYIFDKKHTKQDSKYIQKFQKAQMKKILVQCRFYVLRVPSTIRALSSRTHNFNCCQNFGLGHCDFVPLCLILTIKNRREDIPFHKFKECICGLH